jgi:hypothetical protein
LESLPGLLKSLKIRALLTDVGRRGGREVLRVTVNLLMSDVGGTFSLYIYHCLMVSLLYTDLPPLKWKVQITYTFLC